MLYDGQISEGDIMTKKRFGYGADVNWQGDIIIDYETEKSYDFYEVGDLLNELAEENRKLKGGIYPVDIDIISMALVTSFAKSYITLAKLDQELERMGFSKTNMQRIKIRNKMKRKFESMLFEFIHWSRIKGVF